MNRPITAIVVLAALVSGCTRGPRPEPPEPAPSPYLSGTIQIGRWGVGPIRAETFFESPRIRELFPRAKVEDGVIRIAEDETMAVITVEQDGQKILEIDDGVRYAPGTDDPLIGQVRAVGGPVRGPGGERLNLSWKDAGFDLSQCEIGSEHDANAMVCARSGDGQVTYVFAVPGWDSEEVPPISLLRAKAYLSQIVWTPPPPHRRS
ncbi:MAG: DUF1131 domain-containing protein [Caulobacteraceae bacterium]|nr:DUF1131 domain-containing protein [Caulobacteraceae bacterium]